AHFRFVRDCSARLGGFGSRSGPRTSASRLFRAPWGIRLTAPPFPVSPQLLTDARIGSRLLEPGSGHSPRPAGRTHLVASPRGHSHDVSIPVLGISFTAT